MSRIALPTGLSEKALRDFAFRVLKKANAEGDLRPGTTDLEISFFVDQMTPVQLGDIYHMFFKTGFVQ